MLLFEKNSCHIIPVQFLKINSKKYTYKIEKKLPPKNIRKNFKQTVMACLSSHMINSLLALKMSGDNSFFRPLP